MDQRLPRHCLSTWSRWREGYDGASLSLPPQTIQGIQAKCFRTLPDLISAYQQPNNGLVTPLLYPVHRAGQAADEDSGEPGRGHCGHAGCEHGGFLLSRCALPADAEDARGAGHTVSAVPAGGAAAGSWLSAPIATRTHISQQLHQRLQEQVHSR